MVLNMEKVIDAGKCIRIHQAIRGLNGSQLAVLAGVSRMSVSQWRRQGVISKRAEVRLCEVFGLTKEEFYAVCSLSG